MAIPIGPEVQNRHFAQLNPITYGRDTDSESDGGYGNLNRGYYTVYYIESGKGFLETEGKQYPLKPRDMFILRPHQTGRWWSVGEQGFDYSWIGFDGEMASRIEEVAPIHNISTDVFSRMKLCVQCSTMVEEYLTGLLFELFVKVFDSGKGNSYIKKIENYINQRYKEDLNVDQIADLVGFNRRYISSMFKKVYGLTIKEYIVKVRMENAAKLLAEGRKVNEIASEVGYNDPYNFSKAFKTYYGIPPRTYAKDLPKSK